MLEYEIMNVREGVNKLLDDLEYWVERSMPKNGETWEKKICCRPICSMGHSLGVGVHTVDTSTGFDWGTPEQIRCGCLVKL